MMVAPIIQALAAGHTAKAILTYIAKKFPKYAAGINKAQALGYAAPTILKKLVYPSKDASIANEFRTEHQKALAQDATRRRKQVAGVATAATALVGGAAWLGRGARGAAGAVQTAGGQPPPGGGGAGGAGAAAAGAAAQVPPGGGGGAPPPGAPPIANAAAQPPPPTGATAQAVGQPAAPVQPGPIPTPRMASPEMQKAVQLLPTKIEQQYPHIGKFIDKHLESGKSPEEVYDILQKSTFFKPLLGKIEKELGVPFLDSIKQRSGVAPTPQTIGEQPAPVSSIETATPPIAKGATVITSDGGIGNVVSQKQNHSLVNVGGTNHSVSNDTLESIPKEWENISVDLSKVPEEDRSAPLDFIAPTEDRKNIVVRFWDKKKPLLFMYTRKDGQPFDEDTLNRIANETDAPISNGMKFSGAWSQTGKSRGGAFHRLLKLLSQFVGDPDEPDKPYVFTRIPITFQHGYMKAYHEQLAKAEARFDAYHKKPRKKKKEEE
jgi:hypothetical protein